MKKINTFLVVMAVCISVTVNNFGQRDRGSVNLRVEIDDTVSAGAGVGSDLAGEYIHGADSVTARFTQYGYLEFISGTRIVNAYYSTSAEEPPLSGLPESESGTGVSIKTHAGSNYLQNMAVGSARCVQTTVNFTVGAYTRTIGYNAGYGTISNTGYVKVTRPGENTWIMESDSSGECISQDGFPHDDIARVRDHKTSGKKAPDIDYGRYYMPLRLILTRQ